MSRHIAEVVENIEIACKIYKMTIISNQVAQSAYPGQFIHISIPHDESLLLRRPISINRVNRNNNQVDIIYQVVGKGTKILSGLEKGAELDILGPLGKGFWIPKGTKKIYIVGGGCGVAPVRFIGERWDYLDITSFLGFRGKPWAYQIDEFERFSRKVFVSSDDGTIGYKGSIISLLDKHLSVENPDLVMACGPVPMIQALQKTVLKYDIPCQISLEERMGCGVGGCLVCSCAIGSKDKWDYKKVCTDGPVFWSEEVILDGESETKC
ncbi:MAG: dihydroorotate dehydrogenase electron transfer subunit [Caldicoprobacterales bacterium]|jgi:dihydroorotate dehydrogenase electron transfer subunit|nr:dihydroorotate dehydrogenase electron transfer subunit [Clostridiales bacterium]